MHGGPVPGKMNGHGASDTRATSGDKSHSILESSCHDTGAFFTVERKSEGLFEPLFCHSGQGGNRPPRPECHQSRKGALA